MCRARGSEIYPKAMGTTNGLSMGKDTSDLLFQEVFSLVRIWRLDTREASMEVGGLGWNCSN